MRSGASSALTFSALVDTDKMSIKANYPFDDITKGILLRLTGKSLGSCPTIILHLNDLSLASLLTEYKMVSKRALLVTAGIPDKGDLHSQVYRDMPNRACGTRGRLMKHNRWRR